MNAIVMKCIALASAMSAIVKEGLDVFVETMERLDRYLSPRSDWAYVGSDSVLYETSIDQHGFQFIVQLSVDHQTAIDTLGRFSDDFDVDAVRCDDGRYFYPAVSERQRYTELSCHGMVDQVALLQARREVADDMHRAMMFGRTWFLYELVVTAKRGRAVLAKSSFRGIEAEPQLFAMDPLIDDLTAALLQDVERDALAELARMRPSMRPMKIGV